MEREQQEGEKERCERIRALKILFPHSYCMTAEGTQQTHATFPLGGGVCNPACMTGTSCSCASHLLGFQWCPRFVLGGINKSTKPPIKLCFHFGFPLKPPKQGHPRKKAPKHSTTEGLLCHANEGRTPLDRITPSPDPPLPPLQYKESQPSFGGLIRPKGVPPFSALLFVVEQTLC